MEVNFVDTKQNISKQVKDYLNAFGCTILTMKSYRIYWKRWTKSGRRIHKRGIEIVFFDDTLSL